MSHGMTLRSSSLDSSQLQIKRMSWASDLTNERQFWKLNRGDKSLTCFNEYRAGSSTSDLRPGSEIDRMDAFVVTVNDVRDIARALELFHCALEVAPYQRLPVRHGRNLQAGSMLPHCAVDAEFVKMPRPNDRPAYMQPGAEKYHVESGALEELCSVLIVAVGRHFFLVFNILHMMEHPTQQTVTELEKLYREILFNQKIIKLWWNLQSDIMVMDGTIAHLYQGTARQTYTYHAYSLGRTTITLDGD